MAKMFIRTKETIPSNYEQAGDGHASRVLRVSRDMVFLQTLKWIAATSPDGWPPGGGISSLSGACFLICMFGMRVIHLKYACGSITVALWDE